MFAMLVHVHVLHSHSLFLCVCFPRFRMFLLTVQACQENPGWNPNIMFDTCQTHQAPSPNGKSMRPTKKRSAQNRLDSLKTKQPKIARTNSDISHSEIPKIAPTNSDIIQSNRRSPGRGITKRRKPTPSSTTLVPVCTQVATPSSEKTSRMSAM